MFFMKRVAKWKKMNCEMYIEALISFEVLVTKGYVFFLKELQIEEN